MDQILVCSNKIPSVTAIRNSFIEKYMLDANGSYVKVYLYLSMCMQSGRLDFSISSLADSMENTENDIIRALQHWEKKKLLRIHWHESGQYIVGIEFLEPDEETVEEGYSTAGKDIGTVPGTSAPEHNLQSFSGTGASPEQPDSTFPQDFSVTPEQTSLMAENHDFVWICQIVENFLNRPLKSSEVQLLIYLFDQLHFSKDLILHLYDYCLSLGKSNVKYIQTVALSWAEHQVTTPEQAQALSANYSSTHTAISKALGIHRALAGIECQYIKRWQDEWGMDLSVILEACNRTLLAIQKPDFKYIDGILKSWHKENVHTLQDITQCDERFAQKHKEPAKTVPASRHKISSSTKMNQFQSFPQRSIPEEKMNQLERLLLSE